MLTPFLRRPLLTSRRSELRRDAEAADGTGGRPVGGSYTPSIFRIRDNSGAGAWVLCAHGSNYR
jgi:hypothetical protein